MPNNKKGGENMANDKNKISHKAAFVKAFLVLAALICAYFIGAGHNSSKTKHAGLSDHACDTIDNKISNLTLNALNRDDALEARRTEQLKELNAIFVENCKGRPERKVAIAKVQEHRSEPLPEQTCAAIEVLVLDRIKVVSGERFEHPANYLGIAKLYTDLIASGCADNREKFRELAIHNLEIGCALIINSRDDIAYLTNEASLAGNIYRRLGMLPEALKTLDKIKDATVEDSYGDNALKDFSREFLRELEKPRSGGDNK
jgi:hypothetical protein